MWCWLAWRVLHHDPLRTILRARERQPNLAFFSGFPAPSACGIQWDSFTANFCIPMQYGLDRKPECLTPITNIQVFTSVFIRGGANDIKQPRIFHPYLQVLANGLSRRNTGILATLLLPCCWTMS